MVTNWDLNTNLKQILSSHCYRLVSLLGQFITIDTEEQLLPNMLYIASNFTIYKLFSHINILNPLRKLLDVK